LTKRGEVATLLGWYRALPEQLVRNSAELCADYSWPLLLSGQVDEAERYLTLAEQGAGSNDTLMHLVTVARAYAARIKGDGRRAIELSEQALALLPAEDWQTRGIIATNLGIAHWYAGNLNRSAQVFGEAVEASRRSGNAYAGLAAQLFLCRIKAARGRLRSAATGYGQMIQVGGNVPLLTIAYTDLAKLHYDRNDLAAAIAQAEQGAEIGRRSGQPDLQIAAARTLALVAQARGDEAAARKALSDTAQLVRDATLPPTAQRHAQAYRILLALMAGDRDEARYLAGDSPALEEIGTLPDYLILSLAWARLLLAEQRPAEAYELLRKREARLQAAGFTAAHIDTRAMQALAAPTDQEAARFLAEALALAVPEGYVRPFVDLGRPMAALLRSAAARGVTVDFIGRLLAAFRASEHRGAEAPYRNQPLVEPLSEREIEVLGLLAGGSTNDEIGRSLYVSTNTVKAHLKSIYRKLDVNSRHEAAGKARQLGFL
jgi:LuxR family maltose regulon positive regulatory protein